jgi:hypothetical protein
MYLQIPPSFLPNRKKEALSSQFAFKENKTLVSFTPKKGKSVILLSSMHSEKSINPDTKKPEIIHFYNETKGAVDTFDQMAHNSTVARKTKRWPLRYFYGMLDQCGINSMVLYMFANQSKFENNKKPCRKIFLENLSFSLTKKHMKKRMEGKIASELRTLIEKCLKYNDEADPFDDESEPPAKIKKQDRCYVCPRYKDRKSKTACWVCEKHVCATHYRPVCENCQKKTNFWPHT